MRRSKDRVKHKRKGSELFKKKYHNRGVRTPRSVSLQVWRLLSSNTFSKTVGAGYKSIGGVDVLVEPDLQVVFREHEPVVRRRIAGSG